ncbi:MAG: hypothetical protein IPI67_07455 [Myxococcales bacterium]|nr:hypothetical protein [Myxococcales bacterium]
MRKLIGLLGSTVCVSLLLGACGGDSDSGLGSKDVPIDDVPKLYADAVCKVSEKCLAGLAEVFSGGESCRGNYETAIGEELPRIKQAIEAGRVVYDGKKLDACLSAIAKRDCGASGEPAECTAAIDGTVAEGGDCQLDAECKGGNAYCKVGASCPGKCAPKELAGGPCKNESDCAGDLKCSETTQKCFVPATLDQACEGGGTAPECGGSLFCIGSEDEAKKTGTCKPFDQAFSGKKGEPCFFNGAPACTADLRCIVESYDATAGKLVTACGTGFAAGAACKVAIPDACPIDQFCKVPKDTIDGTCTPKPKAGEPCEPQFDNFVCAAGTRCEDGNCRPLQSLGAQCSVDDVCISGNCFNGGCAPSGGCT